MSGNFELLMAKLKEVSRMGWIPSKREGCTGVGMTLETVLGIPANCSTGPDFHGIEIKCKRIGKNASNYTTLFSKTPEWSPLSRAQLLEQHGSLDGDGRWSLYTTIRGDSESSCGWKLVCDHRPGALYAFRHGKPVVCWEGSKIEKGLSKHGETVFISVESRRSQAGEEFRYRSVEHATQASIDKFMSLIPLGVVTHDFTMHRRPDGVVRDHGFLFRIRSEHIIKLFSSVAKYDL